MFNLSIFLLPSVSQINIECHRHISKGVDLFSVNCFGEKKKSFRVVDHITVANQFTTFFPNGYRMDWTVLKDDVHMQMR